MSLDAIQHNVQVLRTLLPRSTRIMAVVKADAYGHGLAPVAVAVHAAEPTCAFGVATLDEAIEVRRAVPTAEVFLLSPAYPEMAQEVVDAGVVPVVSDASFARALACAGERRGRVVRVHVEVDTGMGRNGVSPTELGELCRAIQSETTLRLDGVMTHFADAEQSYDGTLAQLGTFERAIGALTKEGIPSVCRHACNTAGILLYPEAHYDMVRPGLGVYGLLPQLGKPAASPPMVPALELRARVLLVRKMARGTRLSYGGTHVLPRDSKIAVLGIGYGDGLPWHLSNKCDALLHGRRVSIVGRICMDVCLVDVTDVPAVRAGDIATLIGVEGTERIRAEDLARTLGTTEHEITTRLGSRLPRLYTGSVLQSGGSSFGGG